MRALRALVRLTPPALLAALLAAGLASCGGGDSGSGRASGAASRDAAVADAGDGPSRIVRLVNPRVYPVIILGSAGAEEVLLDTVAAGDSAEQDVRVTSDLLKLRALDLEGHELGAGFLQLGGPSAAGETAAGGTAAGETAAGETAAGETAAEERRAGERDSTPRFRWALPRSP